MIIIDYSLVLQKMQTAILRIGYKINNNIKCKKISSINFNKANTTKELTDKHKKYINMLNESRYKILFSLGYPGTGKTRLASEYAAEQLANGNVEKIIITRPVVPLGEEIGFLPGDMEMKMTPWLKPIDDCFLEYMSPMTLNDLKKKGVIQTCPIAYIRGLTFNNSIVIADESQNLTPMQVKCLLTRIGENSKMILTGDTEQSDLAGLNGLVDFVNRYYHYLEHNDSQNNNIGVIQFSEEDIIRSDMAKQIIKIYNF